jgi:hypothetical protein
MDQPIIKTSIDCACVIHGKRYDWSYVEKLHNMVSRHIDGDLRFHVYTESTRSVPDTMIKHSLIDWEIGNPKNAWWYKMQLFNSQHHAGPLLYFDLDVVIVNPLNWIKELSLNYFWAVHDFKRLYRPHIRDCNSSVMWWDTTKFDWVWQDFQKQSLGQVQRQYRGDQDYLTAVIPEKTRRFFNNEHMVSWRWQCKDGGYDFVKKQHFLPDTQAKIANSASVVIFHGNPKPDQVNDPAITEHWH